MSLHLQRPPKPDLTRGRWGMRGAQKLSHFWPEAWRAPAFGNRSLCGIRSAAFLYGDAQPAAEQSCRLCARKLSKETRP